MTVAPATELLPVPARGRRYAATYRVRLADADPRGLARLDGLARFLQDVASEDADDSGLDQSYGWFVRRTLLVVDRPPVLGERVHLTTFCTGTGRSWAERRTALVGDRGGAVEAVSLWIQVDLASGRPAALGEQFEARYGEAAGGRRVSSRLALPGPGGDVEVRPWTVRATDLDVFGHVNNASHWPILEEVLAGPSFDRVGTAEIEYLAPIDRQTPTQLHVARDGADAGVGAWLVADGRVHTAARWRPASGASVR
ncbi:MAG: acyl-ACP thioesterase domain-containing protein [Ilumatobacteraceae bacterium]